MLVNQLNHCYIKDAELMEGNTTPALVTGNFENGDRCVLLGFIGMEDAIVIVSPRTGLTFEVVNFEDSVRFE